MCHRKVIVQTAEKFGSHCAIKDGFNYSPVIGSLYCILFCICYKCYPRHYVYHMFVLNLLLNKKMIVY